MSEHVLWEGDAFGDECRVVLSDTFHGVPVVVAERHLTCTDEDGLDTEESEWFDVAPENEARVFEYALIAMAQKYVCSPTAGGAR